MDSYSELKNLAEQAGCLEIAVTAEEQAMQLLEQNHTNIVVTGERGSGKTRLINQLVGFEVWEEGRMDDEEKPLRVAFEPLDDDVRFNCLMAANHQWHNEAAVIYEFREEDILVNDCQTNYLDNMDVVLYLISARAPFSINQVNALRALNPLKRYVVLTGLDTIASKDQTQVLEYVNRFIESLNLPPVIVWREDIEQDLGRELRNRLPAFDELQKLRVQHISHCKHMAISKIREKAKSALEANERAWEAATVAQATASNNVNREQREWINLLDELREMQFHAGETVVAQLDRDCASIAHTVLESGGSQHFSAEWRQKAPMLLEKELQKLVETRSKKGFSTYCKDIEDISNSAKALRLSGYEETDFIQLQKMAKKILSAENLGRVSYEDRAIDVSFSNSSTTSGSTNGKTKVLLGTGAAIGFFTLAPFSLATSMIGVVGSVGVGAAYYKKINDEELRAALESGMKEYHDIFKKKIVMALEDVYGEANRILRKCAHNTQLAPSMMDASVYKEKATILNNVLLRCDELLNT